MAVSQKVIIPNWFGSYTLTNIIMYQTYPQISLSLSLSNVFIVLLFVLSLSLSLSLSLHPPTGVHAQQLAPSVCEYNPRNNAAIRLKNGSLKR